MSADADRSSRRVARNTGVMVGGQALSKLASLAFYVLMARKLGQHGFGSFTFALSLAVLLTSFAGFGTDSILAREVARDRAAAHRLFWNAILLKVAVGAIAVVAAIAIVELGDYGSDVRAAVALLAVGALIDLTSKTVDATFLGLQDMWPSTVALVIQRFATAAAGIVALLLGAKLVPLAAIYAAGALLGLTLVARALVRRGLRPRLQLSRSGALKLASTSMPIGIASVFSIILFRADATILSLMKGNAAVGIYGAGYRLLESTLFLAHTFVTATFPVLSRLGRRTTPTIGEAYESGLKVLVAVFLPIGLGFVLFAAPIVNLVYGDAYDEAVTVVRLLGGATVLFGVSYMSSYLLSAQDRQNVIPWISAGVMVQNIVLNVLFIPRHSFDAAAAATTVSEATNALLYLGFALRATGPISLRRIGTGPLAGGVAMGAIALLAGAHLGTLVAGLAAYAAVFMLVEARLFPRDVDMVRNLVRSPAGFAAAEAAAPPGAPRAGGLD
jgi:O-antigen/teichoic acid export membrane protein